MVACIRVLPMSCKLWALMPLAKPFAPLVACSASACVFRAAVTPAIDASALGVATCIYQAVDGFGIVNQAVRDGDGQTTLFKALLVLLTTGFYNIIDINVFGTYDDVVFGMEKLSLIAENIVYIMICTVGLT